MDDSKLAVALVFAEVRFILGVTGWEKLGPSAVETVVWVCFASSLLLADIALQLQEHLRPAVSKVPVAAR